MRAVLLFAALVLLALWFGAARAEAVPSVTFKCTPAPDDCSAWYGSNVSLEWTVLPSNATKTGCQNKTFTVDTAGTNEFCRAVDGSSGVTVDVTIRLDKTRPTVTGGTPSRAADHNGWYTHAVDISFAGSDQTSGVRACTNTTYGGPDSAAASVAGTCTDNAGNVSTPLGYGLKYDATAPVINGAAPERPANAAGWFTSPVRFDLQAMDATSGIADCPPVSYSGPDSATAMFTGSCRDHAANVASRGFALKYDATALPVTGLSAAAGDRSVVLSWQTAADAESVAVVRSPGVAPEPATVVFRGPGAKFADGSVENGVRYTYEVRVADAAGNTGSGTVLATPAAAAAGGALQTAAAESDGPRLLAPARGTVFSRRDPPLLRWTRVANARYYNLQLFRGRKKILSAWPERPRYQLEQRWTFRGKRRRLTPGFYRWHVWPGFGPRSKADYGDRMGPGRFEIRRLTRAPH